MKINHNMSAVIVNNQLKRTDDALSTAIEKLSSGLRINHASDDAAGTAISNKMQAQIDGLDQASRNAADGVSVLQTADGAINEVVNMLQRMRELSVQAANGTNTLGDKDAIQKEMEALTEEIDRVSKDTEFNTKSLLDGTIGRRVYADSQTISNIQVSDSVLAKKYEVQIVKEATSAIVEGGSGLKISETAMTMPEGTITINGVKTKIEEGESMESIYEKIRVAGEEAKVNVFAYEQGAAGDIEHGGYQPKAYEEGDALIFMADVPGAKETIEIVCSNDTLRACLGLSDLSIGPVAGEDAEVTLGDGFGVQATAEVTGNDVTITDRDGFSIYFEIEAGMTTDAAGTVTSSNVTFDVTNIGTMTLQIGANENQTMEISIPDLSAKALGIDRVDVTKVNGGDDAIIALDKALDKVGDVRSKIGAFENRLDSTVSSLDEFSENMTGALSRIADVDMAEEMSEYTKQNVLSQAATAVLSQANDIPQQVLQLLQ